jgi:hypothetical protein
MSFVVHSIISGHYLNDPTIQFPTDEELFEMSSSEGELE